LDTITRILIGTYKKKYLSTILEHSTSINDNVVSQTSETIVIVISIVILVQHVFKNVSFTSNGTQNGQFSSFARIKTFMAKHIDMEILTIIDSG